MPVLAYCLMLNHFHLVLWPEQNQDLDAWRAFPIEKDDQLLTVWCYGERNPLRPNLVGRAED